MSLRVRPARSPLGGRPGPVELPWGAILAAGLTAVAVGLYVTSGFGGGLGTLFGVAVFLLAIAGFLAVPWVMVALTVPLFAALPFLKVFVSDAIGPVKDLMVIAGIIAMFIAALQRRAAGMPARADRWVSGGVIALLAVYIVNAAGSHDLAWFHGTRLVAEPLLLLMLGLTVDQPRRCLRWAMGSLVWTAVGVALYGLVQQAIGVDGLIKLGYVYGFQIRQIGSQLRSFGTLDEPFAYAAFLLLGLAAILAWRRRGLLPVVLFVIVAAGLVTSFVRTALVIAVALLALWIWRRGLRFLAFAVAVSALVVGLNIVTTSSHASSTRSVDQGGSLITLNGRTDVWGKALGGPGNWFVGRGVGVVGTGEERASFGLERTSAQEGANRPDQGSAVDSGYLATIADVGFVGLAVLLLVLGRLVYLSRVAIARGDPAGWVAAGLLLVVLLDAVTRASFTSFPNAFLGFLVIGLALGSAAAAREEEGAPPEAATRR